MAGREETVNDREILQCFDTAEDPFLFTGEVADEFGFSNHGISKRLKQLRKNGYLNVKRSGKVPGWWLSEKGSRYLAGEIDGSELEK